MAKTIEGFITGKGLHIGIVAARFNEFITSKLLGGALDALHRHETKEDDIDAPPKSLLVMNSLKRAATMPI